jgi:glycosyltransferase involved in cell wall biosynthesis
MRILVVSHSCATPINQQIYAEIRRQTGWEFSLLVPEIWLDEFGNSLPSQLWSGFDAQLIRAPVCPSGNIILHWYRTSLRRLLLENKFDAIYVNHEPYAVATAQVLWANRLSVRVPFGFYSCQNIEKQYPPPFCWTERWIYRRSSFAFPITESVANVLRAKGFRGEIAICPLAFDASRYYPRPRETRPGPLADLNGTTLIGYVGRLVEQKGLRTLVEAAAGLPDDNWRLVFVGSGPFESELGELIRAYKLENRTVRLSFVPHEQVAAYLAAFDILVLPSETRPNWKEQFGRVILESLACGTPVIGSNSGEIPNLIRQSGGGLIFAERDSESLLAALRQLVQDPAAREQYASVGKRWSLEYASLEHVAAKMARTIDDQVAMRKRTSRETGRRPCCRVNSSSSAR